MSESERIQTPFVMVPHWLIDVATPRAVQAYVAYGRTVWRQPSTSKRGVVDAVIAGTGVSRSTAYDVLRELVAIGALFDDGGWRLRLEPPHAPYSDISDDASAASEISDDSSEISDESASGIRLYARAHQEGRPCAESAQGELTLDDAARSTSTERATDDPVKANAHALARRAFEQERKPTTRGGFIAVMARIEDTLRSGRDVDELAAAIDAGAIEVWTLDGISTGLARRRSAGSPPSDDRRSPLTRAVETPEVAEAFMRLYGDDADSALASAARSPELPEGESR